MTHALPPLPTSVVGSHGLPGWMWLAREAMEAGRLGAVDLREIMEDATQAAVLDQERAGVDVVTTGEMTRVRFIVGFYSRLTGLRALEPARKLGAPLWDTNTPFEVVEKVTAPRFDKGVNRAVEGVTAKIAVHICFGNLSGRPFAAVRDFRNVYPALRDLAASQIVLEYANRGLDDLRLWREFPTGMELGAGVVDVKAFRAETPTEVAERIRRLLEYVAPGKLWLNPDCGFWETPRWIVKQKLAAL